MYIHTYKYTYVLCMYMSTPPSPPPLLFSPEVGWKIKSCKNPIGPKLH